jgi:F0F1-type ATP synthase assembly protein I
MAKWEKPEEKLRSRRQIMSALMMLTQVGITIAVTFSMSVALGIWLDRLLGTAPLFILIFCLIGVLASAKNMFRMTERFLK